MNANWDVHLNYIFLRGWKYSQWFNATETQVNCGLMDHLTPMQTFTFYRTNRGVFKFNLFLMTFCLNINYGNIYFIMTYRKNKTK